MARGGVPLGTAGRRLEKLADQQRQERETAKRTLDDAYFDPPANKKRKSGKKKGDTHGRDHGTERVTFGSAGLETRGKGRRNSMQDDDPVRDGVAERYFEREELQDLDIDVRGGGKNGQRVEENSDNDDSGDEGTKGSPSESPRRRLQLRQSAGGSRSQGLGRSPLQVAATSLHRSANDVLALKSRSTSGARSTHGSGTDVEQQLALPGKRCFTCMIQKQTLFRQDIIEGH